jgi:hypothetical protein
MTSLTWFNPSEFAKETLRVFHKRNAAKANENGDAAIRK